MGNRERAAEAEAAFRARVDELGVRLIGPYVNTVTRVAAICAFGHECAPRPDKIREGKGPCAQCGALKRVSPKAAQEAEVAFRQSMAESGYKLVGLYVDSKTRVNAICPEGHPCSPRPGHVQQGKGGCELCAGRDHDVVYVVSGNGMVKFGITSGDPSDRLAKHRRDGLKYVHRVCTGLPTGEARSIENQLLAYMRSLHVVSVQGREYFPITVTSLVVSRVDDLLAPWL